MGRKVVIRCLGRELVHIHGLERLQQAALALARLNHPNIVQTYDALIFEGTLAIVTEYVEGRSLRAILRDSGAEYTDLMGWLAEVSAGLEGAHRAGIPHHDLNEDNILVDQKGVARIKGFSLVGTASDIPGDIFTLGALARDITWRNELPHPLLDKLLERMLEQDPALRPTAGEVAEEFSRVWLARSKGEAAPTDASRQAETYARGTIIRLALVAGILAAIVLAAYLNSHRAG